MSNECLECESILEGTGGIKCQIIRYRKYLIGIAIGAIAVYLFKRK